MGMKKLEKRIKNHKTDDEIHWTTIGLIILLFSFAISVCVVLVYYTEKSPCELGLMEWEEAKMVRTDFLIEDEPIKTLLEMIAEHQEYDCWITEYHKEINSGILSCKLPMGEKSCPSDIKLLVVE